MEIIRGANIPSQAKPSLTVFKLVYLLIKLFLKNLIELEPNSSLFMNIVQAFNRSIMNVVILII